MWLITDASNVGVGAWVGQGPTSDTARPAALHSRKFSNAQINYGTTDKEALAIIDALHSFSHILLGRKFTIVTDHRPLIHLKTAKNPSRKQLRWLTELSKYDANIEYQQGCKNYLADALSRVYEDSTTDGKNPYYAKDTTLETDDLSDTTIFETTKAPTRATCRDTNHRQWKKAQPPCHPLFCGNPRLGQMTNSSVKVTTGETESHIQAPHQAIAPMLKCTLRHAKSTNAPTT
ncbi:Ty3/Gypsy family RNase HI domain-containing protein [Providencia sp. PROV201]|uniref:Ty3/Gypsy family RNase HI domain-containing protein n=1 Tax=Providencia sp. PROV201 TaxID=2949901 RepID=UPI003FA6A18F